MFEKAARQLLVATPWETRNLGLPSFQLNSERFSEFDEAKLDDELQGLKEEHEKFFVFARVNKQQLTIGHVLERKGFYLVEGIMCAEIRLGKNELLSKFEQNREGFIPERYANRNLRVASLSCGQPLPKETLIEIAGNAFMDDRFHLDPNCSDETASRRFSYWIADLMNDNETICDVLYLDDEIIGFFARKASNLIIGGFTSRYRQAGLGMYLWLNVCRILKNEGCVTARGNISINNLLSINFHAKLGFRFKNTQYSFHYWCMGRENI